MLWLQERPCPQSRRQRGVYSVWCALVPPLLAPCIAANPDRADGQGVDFAIDLVAQLAQFGAESFAAAIPALPDFSDDAAVMFIGANHVGAGADPFEVLTKGTVTAAGLGDAGFGAVYVTTQPIASFFLAFDALDATTKPILTPSPPFTMSSCRQLWRG
ncbi:MAG: hypothetical protein HRU31_03060 [Rhodobacteraceae bacterium]|nr:hypothetical protein [Paracoccaceae bacterium]